MDRVLTGENDGQQGSNARNIKGVRLAYAPRQFLDLVDPEIEARFRDVLRRLREAGAEIAEVDLGEDFSRLIQRTTWGIFFHETRPEIQRRLNRVFRESEAILLPTTPTTAPLIGQQASFPIAGRSVSALALANHTVSASSVGLPGISLPMGLSRGELPMGLEFDAPLNSDRGLLSLAGRIESVLGFRASIRCLLCQSPYRLERKHAYEQ